MNIFILDEDPILAAQYCIDTHVLKMITEYSQLLANAYTVDQLKIAPPKQNGEPRKYSYLNHPCSKWVLESLDNWKWLHVHAKALCDEKRYRWPDRLSHSSEEFIKWAGRNIPNLPSSGLTPFVLVMPENLRKDNAVEAYRDYYRTCKVFDKSGKRMAIWTRRGAPSWWFKF